jgi:hypothetical protein
MLIQLGLIFQTLVGTAYHFLLESWWRPAK